MQNVFLFLQLGSMEAPFIVPQEVEAREARIKDYFKRELSKLIAEKEMYHVKNLAMAADVSINQLLFFFNVKLLFDVVY